MNFMLDVHERQGYTEVLPPFIVNADSLRGTGQLPKFEEDLFKLDARSDYYLIPTAEVPVTNLHRDEILDAAHAAAFVHRVLALLPQRGRLVRQGHARPDPPASVREGRDREVHARRRNRGTSTRSSPRDAEAILQALGPPLPRRDALHRRHGLHLREDVRHRGVAAGAGDVSRDLLLLELPRLPGAAREHPLPRGDKKTGFVHTLNGSGLPLGRTLVAMLENYQQADGSVIVPEVLRPYLGGMTKI